ncbi:MAG: cell division protein FtsA [Erythrobacter sp.]|uniref:cell division protein FtsA n=1 Tax=Erythrobacter sp. TaxID=1042 RepID=UPI002613025D|nr:cell division protein FtsA [Erythrobacter sp.]MDJ0979915.1 cell division protein FtsA [Erythrobacter sp.]
MAKAAPGKARLIRTFGAVNIGSFRISAMIMGETETGDLVVLGSGHRMSAGVKRGYVTDPKAATHAIRDAVERAEQNAQTPINSVWVACSGAGLESYVYPTDIDIGGRRIEEEDIDGLLALARAGIQPDGREVLHAQPAHFTLDGADGVVNPRGMYAERLGVHVHVTLAQGAPLRNLREAVHNAHLKVDGVVAAPLATACACLTEDERDLGVALVEIGGDVTNVSVFAAGMMLGLRSIDMGSGHITDAIASRFGIRRSQAERLKCVAGSAIASPSDHRELIPVHGPNEGADTDDEEGASMPLARGADEKNRIARSELVSVVNQRLAQLTKQIDKALKELGFAGPNAGHVVLTGGGAELVGLVDFLQGALGVPVRLGRTASLKGLPEAHSTPGFATLAGLCLYAADDPVDIKSHHPRAQTVMSPARSSSPWAALTRLWKASREYF